MKSESLKYLRKKLSLCKREKKRVVFISGIFNIVHPGHLRLLRFASECGDYLIVGVLSDELAQTAQLKQEARLEGVSAIGFVNHAFLLSEQPEEFIHAHKPAVVIKGKEYKDKFNIELEAVQSYGGQLLFGSGDTTFSSFELLRTELESTNTFSIIRPEHYIANHKIDCARLRNILQDFSLKKVCVVGDVIVDEYIQCDPLGMSQEDPTIVVTPFLTNKFLGGAGIVSAHAKSLGAQHVQLISVTGNDADGRYTESKLSEYGVTADLLVDDSRPTTVKQRYRASNKTLLRVNHFRQHKLNSDQQRKLLSKIRNVIKKIDLLIFADFNYGVLPQELVTGITQECIRNKVMVVADSQSSSQYGDISRYSNTALLTPTEREARLALGNFEDGLVIVAEALRKKTNSKNVIITLGAEGILVHAGSLKLSNWITDKLPALNVSPKDPAGAGDCLLVATSLALTVGSSIWEGSYLGSIAAACQVGKIGNIPLTTIELLQELKKHEP